MMSSKDYQLIASVIRNNLDLSARQSIAYAFASALGDENPRFDRDKFIQACNA